MAVSVVSFATITSLLLVSLVTLVTQRALSITGNRGRCVGRPNNGCEVENNERGTDAFHFNLEIFRQ